MTDQEVDQLIVHLEKRLKEPKKTFSGIDYRGQQMRRRILSLCYTLGWTQWSEYKQGHVVDFTRLDNWMKKYGYLHKRLNDYTYPELPRLVTQFENMAQSILDPIKP